MDVLARLSKAVGGPVARAQASTTAPDAKTASEKPAPRRPGAGREGRGEPRSESAAFKENWLAIQASLLSPDQAALHHGITRTDVVARLQDLSDALVSEANRTDEESEIAGPCMEALLEGDLLGRLVRLTANDRVAGSQAEVVRLFASLIILLDERFLSRQAVHRPLVRLMRICVGDEFFGSANNLADGENTNEDEEVKAWRRFGRGGSAEMLGFEEDLVDMMCHVASRLRNTPELLIIFFRDRGGDAEAKRAFDRALTGTGSPASLPTSRTSTRPPSPNGSSVASSAIVKASAPTVSSPLRPIDSLPAISRKSGSGDASSNASASTSLTYDFPLFSYLLRFVHRESRTGELARAGLLFLVDVAFAPGRRNLSRTKRRDGGPSRGQTVRGARGGSLRKPGSGSSNRSRLDVDFGMGPSLALARYMVESDFAEVLGASLGAVYGLLPGKIAISRQGTGQGGKEERSGMSIGGSILPSVEAESLHHRGIELNTSEEVRKQARLLCDLLEFTQDILRTTSRMPNETVEGEDKKRSQAEMLPVAEALTASIGSSIQKLYLENILYPSLLECSDLDGSAVAVMTYLDVMLGVLENDGILADFIIGWLVGKEGSGVVAGAPSKKRKSTAMIQLERERGKRREESAYFSDALGRYTVKDLLLDYLKPDVKPESVIAALTLATTILTYHGRFSLQNVLQVEPDEAATAFPSNLLPVRQDKRGGEEEGEREEDESEEFVYPGASKEDELFEERLAAMRQRAVGGVGIAQHTTEMNLYLSLASLVEKQGGGGEEGETRPGSGSSTGFDNYLDDAEQGVIRDSMFWDGLCSLESGREEGGCYRHRLVSHDALLRALLDCLCRFWQNAPEVNVSLTGFIAVLAMCPMRSLDGFVVFEKDKGSREETESGHTSPPEPTRLAGGHAEKEDDDDRSDDEKEYALGSTGSKAGRRSAASGRETSLKQARPPVLLSIVRSLVLLLDQYRPEVAEFDRLLQERRKGLLFVESLNEALRVGDLSSDWVEEGEAAGIAKYEVPDKLLQQVWEGFKVGTDVMEVQVSRKAGNMAKHISLPPPPSAPEPSVESTPAKREGFARFFGRTSAKKQTAQAATEASSASSAPPAVPQPFAQHYQETSSLYLPIDRLNLSSRSRWSSQYKEAEEKSRSKEKRTRFKDIDGDSDDESFLYPGSDDGKSKARERERKGNLVNLSALLDNAVILEEAIKELAAVLQVRRSIGIDPIRFV